MVEGRRVPWEEKVKSKGDGGSKRSRSDELDATWDPASSAAPTSVELLSSAALLPPSVRPLSSPPLQPPAPELIPVPSFGTPPYCCQATDQVQVQLFRIDDNHLNDQYLTRPLPHQSDLVWLKGSVKGVPTSGDDGKSFNGYTESPPVLSFEWRTKGKSHSNSRRQQYVHKVRCAFVPKTG